MEYIKKGQRVVRVKFELSMPNRGSWNGKWSGDNDRFIIIKSMPVKTFLDKQIEDFIGKDFEYRWDDGWTACVSTSVIDSDEERRLKKFNGRFCGYNWMVDSILAYGKIMTTKEAVQYNESNPSRFHITRDGQIKPCAARVRACPYASESEHFNTRTEAQQYFEKNYVNSIKDKLD